MRFLYPLCLIVLAAGCAKPTAYWVEKTKADDPALRLHAVHMLQGRTSESATVVPALIDAMQDKNLYVRRDAARALADFGPEAKAAVEPLIARLKDEEPSVRKAAAASLKQIDPAAAKKAGVP